MRSTSIFLCITTIVSKFVFFLSFTYLFSFFSYKYNRFLHFHMILSPLLLITSFFPIFKKFIFIVCSLKCSQNAFIQFLPLYTACLFSMLLNGDIVDIEKRDGICWLTFVVDKFSGRYA